MNLPKALSVLVLGSSLLLIVACNGSTTGATNVGTTTARLNYQGHCDTGNVGRVFEEYRDVSQEAWTRTSYIDVLPDNTNTPHDADTNRDPCQGRIPASGEAPGFFDVSGLTTDTVYEYRVGFKHDDGPGTEQFADTNSGPIGANPVYDRFVPRASCTTTTTPANLEATVDAQPAGARICVSAGSANVGFIRFNKANQTIVPIVESDDTFAAVTLTGDFEVTADGVTIEQMTLVNDTPGSDCNGGGGLFQISGDNVTLRHDDLNGAAGRSVVLVGTFDGPANNIAITDSKVHNTSKDAPGSGCGGGDLDHPIYLFWASGGTIARNWIYDTRGYITQFNGDVDSIDYHHNVGDDSVTHGWGLAFDSDGASDFVPDHNRVHDVVFTDAGTVHCNPGSPNQSGTDNTVVNSTFSPFTDECGPGTTHVAFSGISTTDPTYENEAGRDYRVVGNSAFRFRPGPQT
jgi:hypothetical protein